MSHTAAPTPTTKRHWHSKERRRLEGRLPLSLIFEDPNNKGPSDLEPLCFDVVPIAPPCGAWPSDRGSTGRPGPSEALSPSQTGELSWRRQALAVSAGAVLASVSCGRREVLTTATLAGSFQACRVPAMQLSARSA